MIAVDTNNASLYYIPMPSYTGETITYICEYCGNENTKRERKDLKYRFCNTTCNAKSRVGLLNSRDRSGSKNPAWIGGRKYNGAGYILVYKPSHPYHNDAKGIYVFEHRLVMEKKIGRILSKEEVVHHINHIKNDNRPNNLMLLNQKEHVNIHGLPKQGYAGFLAKKKVVNCLECGKETIMKSPNTKYCDRHRK